MGAPKPSMREVDFSVKTEDWSRYRIGDKTILRIRVAVRKIFEIQQPTPTGYPNVGIESTNIVTAMVQDEMKGRPSEAQFDPASSRGTEVEFERIGDEAWQEYSTQGGFRVLVRPVLVKVLRYDSYNAFGEPIYHANIQNIVDTKAAK